MQILDPMNGQVIWNRVDKRVEPDDMFVALEVINGHLFWCTNHGYYGFVALPTSRGNLGLTELLDPIPIDGLAELVSLLLSHLLMS